jgi:hypothetical protein
LQPPWRRGRRCDAETVQQGRRLSHGWSTGGATRGGMSEAEGVSEERVRGGRRGLRGAANSDRRRMLGWGCRLRRQVIRPEGVGLHAPPSHDRPRPICHCLIQDQRPDLQPPNRHTQLLFLDGCSTRYAILMPPLARPSHLIFWTSEIHISKTEHHQYKR